MKKVTSKVVSIPKVQYTAKTRFHKRPSKQEIYKQHSQELSKIISSFDLFSYSTTNIVLLTLILNLAFNHESNRIFWIVVLFIVWIISYFVSKYFKIKEDMNK